MKDNFFKVTYAIKRLNTPHGEFSERMNISFETYRSNTNESDEIFTDLYFLHRSEHVTAIEIISVEMVEGSISEQELETNLSPASF